MNPMFNKICETCSRSFLSSGPAGRYCADCGAPSKTKEYGRVAMLQSRARQGKLTGIGSGNHPDNKFRTEQHPLFKNGWTRYKQIGRKMKEELGECNRCGKDLSSATRGQWACHHKDHNRTNCSPENLELLCKRYHQVEHECWKAFEGATTISQESTPKRAEVPDAPLG